MLLRGVVSMAATNGAKKIPIDIVRCASAACAVNTAWSTYIHYAFYERPLAPLPLRPLSYGCTPSSCIASLLYYDMR